MKILFVKLSAIGDVTHVLPIVKYLKLNNSEIFIGWVVQKLSYFLLKDNPFIDKIHIMENKDFRNYVKIIRELKEEKYEVSIDFQGLTKSAIIPFFAGIKKRIGFGDEDGREISKLFYNYKVIPDKGLHIIDKNFSLVKVLGFENFDVNALIPYIYINFSDDIKDKFKDYNIEKSIIINPGGGWKTKIWSIKYYQQLISMLVKKGFFINILWGPGEEKLARKIYDGFNQNYAVKLFPPTNLLEMSYIVKNAKLVIGGDTGPLHIAAGFGTKTICIFGPSDSRRNAPIGKNISLQKFLSCGPCWNRKYCKYNLKCLTLIKPMEVYKAVEEIL